MSSTVKITYNSFTNNLNILVNDNPISEYSRVLMYSKEPFYIWCDKILDILYEELNEDFILIFSAMKEEIQVMRQICDEYDGCIKFVPSNFEVNIGIQKRMGLLNQILKEDKSLNYKKKYIDTLFYLQDNLKKYTDLINNIQIDNSYCKVNTSIVNNIIDKNINIYETCFYIIEDSNFVNSIVEQVEKSYYFVLIQGNNNQFLSKKGNAFIYEFDGSEQGFFEICFTCFLLIPLKNTFIEFIKNNSFININEKIRKLSNIEADIIVNLENNIELNRTSPVDIYYEDKRHVKPEILWKYSEEGIVDFKSTGVRGLKEGQVDVFLYKKGDFHPFKVINLNVIKRNRVTDILFYKDNLVLGLNDKYMLEFDLVPSSADNKDKLEWMVKNKSIVSINNLGLITAKSVGKTYIYCSVESVSKLVQVQVKPYLEDIILYEEEILMNLNDKYELRYDLKPQDCINSNISISSENNMIVNVVGNNLYAKSIGEVSLFIENNLKTIQKNVKVKVVENKEKIIKKEKRKEKIRQKIKSIFR